MSVTLVSSLDVFSRQKACAALAAESPGALVVFHDLLEDGLVVRRVFQEGRRIEHAEATLEHPCLSCTVRLDVVPTVRRLLESVTRIIVGLPPAVASETAVHALLRGLGVKVTIDSVVLACAPDAIEDQIWDHHTLFESGFTPVPEDERTPGEFLMRELCFADTVLLADPALVPVDPVARLRGVQLIREVAPRAVLTEDVGAVRTGGHNLADATARTVKGTVRAAAEPSGPFTTVVQRIERPLHPERFAQLWRPWPRPAAGCAEDCGWHQLRPAGSPSKASVPGYGWKTPGPGRPNESLCRSSLK